MKPSRLMKRIAAAKLAFLGIALLYLLLLRGESASGVTVELGFVAGMLTTGAFVGLVGFYELVPGTRIPLGAFARGTICGSWMGILLFLLAGPEISRFFLTGWVEQSTGPLGWGVVLEMAFLGAAVDLGVTRAFGATPWRASGVSQITATEHP